MFTPFQATLRTICADLRPISLGTDLVKNKGTSQRLPAEEGDAGPIATGRNLAAPSRFNALPGVPVKRRAAVRGNRQQFGRAFSHTSRSSPVAVNAGYYMGRRREVDLLQADQGLDKEYVRSDEPKGTGTSTSTILDHLKDIAFLCILVILILTFIFR